LVKKQGEELMKVIEEEEILEEKRNQKLNQITDAAKKESMDHEYGVLRGKASERIITQSKKHDRNLVQLEKKLRGVN
jgi:hypothetical protein